MRNTLKTAVLFTALAVATCASAQSSLPDTPENRMIAAHRIVQNGSFIRMVIDNEIRKLPPHRQDAMREIFAKPGVQEAMETSLLLSLSNNFTPPELAILAPLYGSREGVEALRKFDSFNRDLAAYMLQQFQRLNIK